MAQANAPAYKRVNTVTRNTLKLVPEKPLFLKITSAIHASASQGKRNSDGTVRKPASVMLATDMKSGEEVQIVVPTVLESNLKTHYPDDSYNGRCFEIVKHAPGNGKDYSTFDIWEIEAQEEAKK